MQKLLKNVDEVRQGFFFWTKLQTKCNALVVQALWHRSLNIQFIYLFVCFWRHWVFLAARGLPLVSAIGSALASGARLSLRWPLSLQITGSVCSGGQSQLVGPGTLAPQLWHTGLVAPWRVESSQIRDRTSGPCISRRILIRLYYQGCPPQWVFKNLGSWGMWICILEPQRRLIQAAFWTTYCDLFSKYLRVIHSWSKVINLFGSGLDKDKVGKPIPSFPFFFFLKED